MDTEGFHGQGCQAIHQAFESMGTVTKETIKPEFYAGPGNGNRVRQDGSHARATDGPRTGSPPSVR